MLHQSATKKSALIPLTAPKESTKVIRTVQHGFVHLFVFFAVRVSIAFLFGIMPWAEIDPDAPLAGRRILHAVANRLTTKWFRLMFCGLSYCSRTRADR